MVSIFYYRKGDDFVPGKSHIKVFSEKCEDDDFDLESYFETFNDSEENPLATQEHQEFLQEHQLHTSMSTGDVVQYKNDYWQCGDFGWEKIEK